MSNYNPLLEALREEHFLRPNGSNLALTLELVKHALSSVLDNQGDNPTFHRAKAKLSTSEVIASAQLTDELSLTPTQIVDELAQEIGGSVKASDPYMVKNVLPIPSMIHLACYLAVSTYMPNGVTGEDAADCLNAELKLAKIYAELAGYDYIKSGGLFTFGGTGTNLYAFKIGISKAQPDHFFNGDQKDLVIVGSKPAHFSHQTAATWLGVGRNNYLTARSNIDQTTNLEDLERICREQIENGKKVACIVGVGGTTSNMGIDDYQKLAVIRDKLVQDYKLDYIPHLHCDSVIGWAYLHFKKYDFEQNPLGFSDIVLTRIEKIISRLDTLTYADSFGIDFHKTGYMPYVSSMIIVKDKNNLADLGRESEMMTPLFHDEDAYNPGKFSLETSRSAANMVATWMTVRSLGHQGYQVLLGHAQEMSQLIKDYIKEHGQNEGVYVANQQSYGSDVFIRCYPPGTDPETTYQTELYDNAVLKANTDYNSEFFKWLQVNRKDGESAVGISKTSAAFYTHTNAPMVAIRVYVLNPYITEQTSVELVNRIIEAKKIFDKEKGYNLNTTAQPNKPITL